MATRIVFQKTLEALIRPGGLGIVEPVDAENTSGRRRGSP